jgi:nicotinamidase/pyrazinamidase
MEKDLIIIDPQTDFCLPSGSLFVPNADKDMERLAKFIDDNQFGNIFVTMDTHSRMSIFHPSFWKTETDLNPNPFTMISVKSIEQGTWKTTNPLYQRSALAYVKALAAKGNQSLIVWPEHCIIGTEGWHIHPLLQKSLDQWEYKNAQTVHYWIKGMNPFTEMYSALSAEVVNDDSETAFNTKRYEMLTAKDTELLIAGEAKTHCVFSTIKDMFRHGEDVDLANRMTIIDNAMSPVPGFPQLEEAFDKLMDENNINRMMI